MNDLNSVVITGRAVTDWPKGNYMLVVVHNCRKENGKMQEKNIAVPVLVKGENLLKTAKNIEDGTQVRVVGKLDFDKFFLFIDAEQMEVKL